MRTERSFNLGNVDEEKTAKLILDDFFLYLLLL